MNQISRQLCSHSLVSLYNAGKVTVGSKKLRHSCVSPLLSVLIQTQQKAADLCNHSLFFFAGYKCRFEVFLFFFFNIYGTTLKS